MTIRSRILRLAYPLLAVYWHLKPNSRVVRVVVRRGGSILFVRHAYGAEKWGLPGGGIKVQEDPMKAGVREVFEETGVTVSHVKPADKNPVTMNRGTMWVYEGTSDSADIQIDNFEIVDARWFPERDLPKPILKQAIAALEALGISVHESSR